MKNKKLLWVGIGSVIVVGVGVYLLVRANREKLAKDEYSKVSSLPGFDIPFDSWKKMTKTEREAYIKTLVPVGSSSGISTATPGYVPGGLKLNISSIAKGIGGLFNPKEKTGDKQLDKKNQILVDAQKASLMKSRSELGKKIATSQFGIQL